MVYGKVMLCVHVALVCWAQFPVETELALDHSALDPMKTHVDQLDLLDDDGVVCDTSSSGVVSLHRCLKLRP